MAAKLRIGMITVYGTVCLDRLRRVAKLPPLGGYAEILGEQVFLGGEAANTAVALRYWEANVEVIGNEIGDDDSGQWLRNALRDRNLSDAGIPTSSVVTPFTDIYVTPDGERTMFGMGFADMYLHSPVNAIRPRAGDWITFDPNHGIAARQAAVTARAAGMRIYALDFNGEDEPIDADTFWQSSTDWVGYRGNTQRNVEFVRKWVDRYGCYAILSDGPNGFVAGSTEHEIRHYPPFPCPKLVDSTGAGDVFRAGMLFGLSQVWSLPDCLRFASVAGCLNCRGLGATGDLPTKDEILSFVARHPGVASHYG
ncbi:MAG: Sulfofructose kinase [Fimbriimonadaceae bacterium]|nr:Sulfofructose kinase [Fimbriimonadaceae bacterium]